MNHYQYTTIPNKILDDYLCNLGYAELKVLLVVIRQTLGWLDKRTGKSKEWDWISNQFFVKKTGLSRRAVSDAISTLFSKHLIIIKNEDGRNITRAIERKHAHKLFYKINANILSKANTSHQARKLLHSTITTHTNKSKEVTSHEMKRISFKNYPQK